MSRRLPRTRTRREFVKTSAGVAAGAVAGSLVGGCASTGALLGGAAHVGGSDVIRVGLVGCGGRGTGAAAEALAADPGVRLVALGDLFGDRVEKCLENLRKEDTAAHIEVDPEHCFTGFDAYERVIEQCDVVLLATTPHFRPQHLEAAVAAGKHVFCEKPVAVDGPGIRRVLAAAEEAKRKHLSLVSGFCWRYADPDRETFARLHDGAIGKIQAIHTNYLTGTLGYRERKPSWSDMEYQLRNWYYYTWASGDHIVEQAIHSIDKIAWAMQDVPPARAYGVGGRQVRTEPKWGHVFDHFSIVYEWEDGTRAFHLCRQNDGCHNDNTDYFVGTKGTCFVNSWGPTEVITGENPWTWSGKARNKYQTEHDDLFASIRAGKPIHDGVPMAHSTLMSILGRMAAYTGRVVTWQQALESQERLGPETYAWGALPVDPVAMPGRTPLA